MTLDDFRGSFQDVSRGNRFKVELTGSALNQYRNADIKKKMTFWCSKAQLPKIDVAGPAIKYLGRTQVLTGDVKEMTSTLTFINMIHTDGSTAARNFFESWILDLVQHQSQQTRRLPINEYIQGNNILITRYGNHNRDNIVTGEYTLIDVVPVMLSEMELDHSSEGIEEFTVEFRHNSWVNSKIPNSNNIDTR